MTGKPKTEEIEKVEQAGKAKAETPAEPTSEQLQKGQPTPIIEEDFPIMEFFRVARRLEPHHGVFYKLWELGRPVFSNVTPTACVGFDEWGQCVQFNVNPVFWKTLSEEQQAFIISHEMLHVILEHGKRARNTSTMNRDAANVAMDIVVNELLVSEFGFRRSEIDPPRKEMVNGKEVDLPQGALCWRDKIFPKTHVEAEQTFEYYYNRLPTLDLSNMALADDHSQLGGMPMKLPGHIADRINDALAEEEKKKLDAAIGQHAGTEAGSDVRIMTEKRVVKKRKWETVIKRWTQRWLRNDPKDVEQWIRVNRRLAMMPQQVILPTEMEDFEDKEKNRIPVALFLDTSGSCTHLADRFWKAAMSLPDDRFDVRLYCFDTKVYKVDPKVRKLYGFGGTSFGMIEAYIQQEIKNKNLSRYPEAVFIITDGYGDSISPQKPENWHWFLTEGGATNYIPSKSKTYHLKDFE